MTREISSWTHKVVKMARGNRGQWFSFPAATTGRDVNALRAYAERFAAQQTEAGVVGARVVVLARRGGACIAEYRIG